MEPQSKNVFRIHLGLLLAELICIPAFIIEMFRALGGNMLSWAYVFEWPALGCYAVYMWRRMILEERGLAKPKRAKRTNEDDPRLDAWNEYLATVHQQGQPLTPDKRDD
jgi:hypothetical protein